MWLFSKEDGFTKELKKKSNLELEQIIKGEDERKKSDAKDFIEKIMVIRELEKRLHEIKFHGREGDIKKINDAINAGYKNISAWIRIIIFNLSE